MAIYEAIAVKAKKLPNISYELRKAAIKIFNLKDGQVKVMKRTLCTDKHIFSILLGWNFKCLKHS